MPEDVTSQTHDAAPSARRCDLCDDGSAAWMHRLYEEKSHFRVYGKGHVWASLIAMCERCEQLYRAGDDEGLVAVQQRSREETAEDVDEAIRKPLAALRRADLGPITMSDWLPPGIAELSEEGFVPIEDLMGEEYLARVWPEEHCRAVPETRSEWAEFAGDGLCWLVRSPWSAIPVEEVVDLMWDWHRSRHAPRGGGAAAVDPEQERALVREFLDHDEDWALRFRDSRRGGGGAPASG